MLPLRHSHSPAPSIFSDPPFDWISFPPSIAIARRRSGNGNGNGNRHGEGSWSCNKFEIFTVDVLSSSLRSPRSLSAPTLIVSEYMCVCACVCYLYEKAKAEVMLLCPNLVALRCSAPALVFLSFFLVCCFVTFVCLCLCALRV